VRWVLIALIRVYQVLLSPFLGGQCRYEPSCSRYGIDAIERYGGWRGGWMTVKRIGRCHPFAKGGYDPVPYEHISGESTVEHVGEQDGGAEKRTGRDSKD